VVWPLSVISLSDCCGRTVPDLNAGRRQPQQELSNEQKKSLMPISKRFEWKKAQNIPHYYPFVAVLWNRNYLLRFRFRLWKSFGSGSFLIRQKVEVPAIQVPVSTTML
jgi:hypothetical protein